MISQPTQTESTGAVTPELGPLVLEQRATHGVAVVYLLAGALFAAMGLLALVFPIAPDRRVDYASAAVVMPLGLAYLLAGVHRLWHWRGGALYLHERGIRERRAGLESFVSFDQVTEMMFHSTRVFVHGSYVGTVERLSVRTAGPRGRELFFQRKHQEKTGLATGYTEPSDVDRVARNVSNVLIRRFWEQLEQGGTVDWTSRMRLRPDGLELSRKRWHERSLGELFVRQPAWQFVAWRDIERTQLDLGVLSVWVQGSKQPRVKVLASGTNFRPGYAIFAALMERATQATAPAIKATPAVLSAQNRAENLVLRFTWTVADHVARQRHYDRTTAEGRAAVRGRIWIPTGIAAGFALLLIITAWLYNRVGTPVFVGMLLAVLPGAALMAALLHYVVRLTDRFRIVREIRAAHVLARSGKTADPLSEFEVILGPPGYAYRRSGGGEAQFTWPQIARVEFAAGYIFITKIGDKLQPEFIQMMLPPQAFANANEARATFERIHDWHARARQAR